LGGGRLGRLEIGLCRWSSRLLLRVLEKSWLVGGGGFVFTEPDCVGGEGVGFGVDWVHDGGGGGSSAFGCKSIERCSCLSKLFWSDILSSRGRSGPLILGYLELILTGSPIISNSSMPLFSQRQQAPFVPADCRH
jgi:hypothetical protein